MEDKKEIINIQGVDIPYEIIINGKLKYMRIRMDQSGMRVSVPGKLDKTYIHEFLRSKGKWILKHYENFKGMEKRIYVREWKDGEKILYKGVEYELAVYDVDDKGVRVSFDGHSFKAAIGRGLSDEDRINMIEAVFKKLFIKMAREAISERLHFYSSIIGVKFNDVRIKEQKTRWGSCSKKGNLNFNWKIVMAPEWVMDYIIVHELCHLKFLDHSKRFWDMVEGHMPQYKKARQWLKENGRILCFR